MRTTAMGSTATAATMPPMTDGALHLLLAWASPALPIGAFGYSQGLEAAVADGSVRDRAGVRAFVAAVVMHGGGFVDAVLFAAAHRAVADPARLSDLNMLALAFRATAETRQENAQQGRALLGILLAAYPRPAIRAFAEAQAGAPVALAVVAGLAAAAHGVPLGPALQAFLHALAANLVSAGVRLVPLGQTEGQQALVDLFPCLSRAGARALATAPEDLGISSIRIEEWSMHHETLYSRLFRS